MRLFVLVCLCGFALTGCASRQPVCGEPVALRDNTHRQITVLGDDLSPLRSAFNDKSDQWRAVALVSPTCSECVLGAEVVEKEITARYPAQQVPALIVWIPMLPSDNEKAARALATIFPQRRVSQFYDSQQNVGWEYARETFAGFPQRARQSLPDGHWLTEAFDDRAEVLRPQWDLYMLYAPGVRWEQSSAAPPMPTHWIRHFGRKEDRKTSTYWQDTPESGPREGDLYTAIRSMADQAIGRPQAMKVEVLGFEGCPNTPQTRANVEKAVASLGVVANVVYVDQMKLPENDRRRGWPTPTVLIDGRDLFGMPEPQGSAMGCRMYAGGAPSEDEIVNALRFLSRN
jgi:hypothetical protein